MGVLIDKEEKFVVHLPKKSNLLRQYIKIQAKNYTQSTTQSFTKFSQQLYEENPNVISNKASLSDILCSFLTPAFSFSHLKVSFRPCWHLVII